MYALQSSYGIVEGINVVSVKLQYLLNGLQHGRIIINKQDPLAVMGVYLVTVSYCSFQAARMISCAMPERGATL